MCPIIEVKSVKVLNAIGLVCVTLKDGYLFECSSIERHQCGAIFFEIEMPGGVFKGRRCLLSPQNFVRFRPEPYDDSW